MKTPEELAAIKEEVEALKKKLSELTDDEIALVTGGFAQLTRRPDNTQGTAVPNNMPKINPDERYVMEEGNIRSI